MKSDNSNMNNNIQNKKLLMNSDNKKLRKNIDINCSYSSDEDNNEPERNENNNLSKRENNNNLALNNIKRIDNTSNMNSRINKYNLNRNNQNSGQINNNKNNNLNNINNINFIRGTSAQINDSHFKKNIGYTDNQLSNNIRNNDYKRALSGEKNLKPIHNFFNLPEEKKNNSINRITSYNSRYHPQNKNLQSNYAPTYNNTKIYKVEKAQHSQGMNIINNDIISNNMFNNTFNPNLNRNRLLNNYNNNSNYYLNQTKNFTANRNNQFGTSNYTININKLPSDDIDRNFGQKTLPINSIKNINNINRVNPEPELERGNNTIGFLSYRKPYSNEFNNNFLKAENPQGMPNVNKLSYQRNNPMNNTGSINNNIQAEEDDGRFHELSLSNTFNRFNRFSSMTKPLGFEEVLKKQQSQQNNVPNKQIGRGTFVKKLPPLNENENMDDVENSTLNKKLSGTILDNQMNPPKINNMANIRETDISKKNSFGNNINVKKIPPETNNINNNLNFPKANIPINNRIPNAATYNPKIQNLNQINNPNNVNNIASNMNNQTQFFPSRSINVNILPKEQIQNNKVTQFITAQNQVNYNINNQIIPQSQILERSASPDELVKIAAENQYNNNIEQNEQNNEEPNEENEEENQIENNNEENNYEQNNEQQNEQNEQNEVNEEIEEDNNNEEKYQKDPNISYNEFDSTGILKNYGGLSRQGVDSNGNQKINQDSLVSLTNINNIKDFNIFGVLDGHGPEGHQVSSYASEFIPNQITENPEIKSLKDPELIYQKLKENNCQIITEAFLLCDEQLKQAEFDTYNSGSTCILIIHVGQHILCANVGDSRALVTFDDQDEDPELNYLEEAQLSIDYKPELEEEKNRIILSGGRVEKMKNQFGQGVGPFRVWEKNEDYPGLAMSRSIGDLKGKAIGVISEPGILEYDLNEATKYIVIASDGVWEFMKNEEVRDLGKSFYLENDSSGFCHKIVDTSASIWQKRDIVVDDITIVVMFF